MMYTPDTLLVSRLHKVSHTIKKKILIRLQKQNGLRFLTHKNGIQMAKKNMETPLDH